MSSDYVDSVFPATDEAAEFAAIRARHVENGVPVDSWRSLRNVGLSLSHYAAEGLSTARNLWRRVLRGMYLSTLRADWLAAETPAQRRAVRDAAEALGLSAYAAAPQPASFAELRVYLSCPPGSDGYSLSAGQVVVGTVLPTPDADGGQSVKLLRNAEPASGSIAVEPGHPVVLVFRAESPGAAYNVAQTAPVEVKVDYPGLAASVRATGEVATLGTGAAALSFSTEPSAGVRRVFVRAVPGGTDAPLTIGTSAVGDSVYVSINLATEGATPASTARSVRDLMQPSYPFAAVFLPAGSDGSGVVQPFAYAEVPASEGNVARAGQDEQPVGQFLDGLAAQWAALGVGFGTDDALYWWATRPAPGERQTRVGQIKVLTGMKPDGTFSGGHTVVLVSGQLGPLAAPQLAAVAALLEGPRKYAAGTVVHVVNASTVLVSVSGVVYFDVARASAEQVSAAVGANFAEYQRLLPMGAQAVDAERVRGLASDASPAVRRFDAAAPLANVVLAWDERVAFDLTGLSFLPG